MDSYTAAIVKHCYWFLAYDGRKLDECGGTIGTFSGAVLYKSICWHLSFILPEVNHFLVFLRLQQTLFYCLKMKRYTNYEPELYLFVITTIWIKIIIKICLLLLSRYTEFRLETFSNKVFLEVNVKLLFQRQKNSSFSLWFSLKQISAGWLNNIVLHFKAANILIVFSNMNFPHNCSVTLHFFAKLKK